MSASRIVSSLGLVLLGCAPEVAGPDQELGAASASVAEPLRAARLDHGEVWFGAAVEAELSEREPTHSWSFELPAAASVTFATRGSASGPDLDTVLSLYRVGLHGRARLIARADGGQAGGFAELSRELRTGRYRIVVRARAPRAIGKFLLSSSCSGTGCAVPAEQRDCLFGEEVSDLAARLRLSTILSLRSNEEFPLPEAEAQLVASSAHLPAGPLTSADELFDLVDSGLVRWVRLWDDAGGRAFSAFEYRVAGESYGAIFDDAGHVVAGVEAAEIVDCQVPVRSCALGTTFHELRDGRRFATIASRKLQSALAASTLSSLEQAQLLDAVRVAYEEVADLTAAFSAVDSSEVNQLVLRDRTSDVVVVAYEYGAGDNSYGGVFIQDAPELVARINDGDLIACTLLE